MEEERVERGAVACACEGKGLYCVVNTVIV